MELLTFTAPACAHIFPISVHGNAILLALRLKKKKKKHIILDSLAAGERPEVTEGGGQPSGRTGKDVSHP